jgi:hypothetical protein
MDLGSAPEYDPEQTAALRLPSWGSLALRRSRQREATHTGLASPGCAAPSGFLSLLTPCSSRSPPALFHAGGALGLWPFRGLLLPRGRPNLSAGLPLLALPGAVLAEVTPVTLTGRPVRPPRPGLSRTLAMRPPRPLPSEPVVRRRPPVGEAVRVGAHLQGFELRGSPCVHPPSVTPNGWSRSSPGFSSP